MKSDVSFSSELPEEVEDFPEPHCLDPLAQLPDGGGVITKEMNVWILNTNSSVSVTQVEDFSAQHQFKMEK